MRVWASIKWAFGWPSRVLRWLLRPVDVLVLGSAHIDTTGEIEGSAFTTGQDHEGRIVYSVGGSGYNVAVNLATSGNSRRIALNTLLPKDSRLADLVTTKLVQNGVSLGYVRRISVRREQARDFVHAAMGGYVAIRARDDTVSSVSRTLVDTPDFSTRARDRIAIGRARAVVVDTYVLEAARHDVVERAIARRIPLFVCVTTDSTARRFARSLASGTFFAEGAVLCVVGTAGAIDAMMWEIDPDTDRHAPRIPVLRSQLDQINPQTARAICQSIKARYVACIYDLRVTILAWNGDHLRIDMKDLEGYVQNQKGDSDALMAAIVDAFLSLGRSVGSVSAQEVLDLNNEGVKSKLTDAVRRHVRRAVSSYGATLGSVISFEEPFETWGQLLDRQVKYTVMQAVNAIGWLLIVFATDFLAKYLVGEHLIRLSFRKVGTALGVFGKGVKVLIGWFSGY